MPQKESTNEEKDDNNDGHYNIIEMRKWMTDDLLYKENTNEANNDNEQESIINDLPQIESTEEEQDDKDDDNHNIIEMREWMINDLPYKENTNEENGITTENSMVIDMKRADPGVFDAASLV